MVSRVADPDRMEPIEKASIGELRSLQLERLRWTLEHTYKNVAPFQAKCDATGVAPGHLQSLEDLSLFPFTVKDDLRQSYPFGMFAVPQKEVVRIHLLLKRWEGERISMCLMASQQRVSPSQHCENR